MPYRVLIKNSAKADLRIIKASNLKESFDEVVSVLKEDPYKPTQQFKRLRPHSEGRYSRRINIQHRVVYTVSEEKKEVYIYSAWSHYNE